MQILIGNAHRWLVPEGVRGDGGSRRLLPSPLTPSGNLRSAAALRDNWRVEDKFTETLQFTCIFLIFFLYDNCGMMYKEARQQQ
jgi:hypothetical protein